MNKQITVPNLTDAKDKPFLRTSLKSQRSLGLDKAMDVVTTYLKAAKAFKG